MYPSVSVWAHNQQFQQQAHNNPTIPQTEIHYLEIYGVMNLDANKITLEKETI